MPDFLLTAGPRTPKSGHWRLTGSPLSQWYGGALLSRGGRRCAPDFKVSAELHLVLCGSEDLDFREAAAGTTGRTNTKGDTSKEA